MTGNMGLENSIKIEEPKGNGLPEEEVQIIYEGEVPPLYKHQETIIKENKLKCGLFLGTGASKTRTALELAEGKTLVICPKQQREDKTWERENKKWETKVALKVISKEDIRKMWDTLPQYTTVIIDECVSSETEVLTEDGFKHFDKLNKTEKIAQWDEGEISFVKPLRYIEKHYDGAMVSFRVKKGVDVLMTPNHDQILFNKKTKLFVKKPISKCCFHDLWRLPVSGKSIEKSDGLPPLERAYIATQANGCIHYESKNHTMVSFSLNKKRKIDRLKKIAKEASLELYQIKHDKKRYRARLMLKMPTRTTKDISNHIKYPMSYLKAKEIIAEMVEWDGHRIKGGTQFYFSSKDKTQSDFYAQVAVLAGHRCYQSIQVDNRKKSYHDIHRLYITLNKKTEDTQKCKKTYTKFKGKVYCVEVPSGAIIVRHNGFVFVTGNCHNNLGVSPMYVQKNKVQIVKTSQIFEATKSYIDKHSPKRLYLLSATPVPKPMSMWAIGTLFGQDWDFEQFRRVYYVEIRVGGIRRIWVPKKDDIVKERLARLVQRFGYTGGLNDFFDVPAQTHKTIEIELSNEQKKAIAQVTRDEADILVRRARLRTIENGVLYGKKIEELEGKIDKMTNQTTFFKSNKIDYILERAQEFPKLLIFANYTAQIEETARILRKEGYKVSVLNGKTKDRSFIKTVNDSDQPHIIVAQSSISSGYELPSFPCVIYASKSWRFVDYEQSLGRVLRANKLKKNLYIHLVVEGCDKACHDTIMSGQDFQEKLTLNI